MVPLHRYDVAAGRRPGVESTGLNVWDTCRVDEVGDVVSGALERLRAVLALVESGELSAGPDQLAYLKGAADALRVVAGQVEPPVTKP